MPLRAEVASRWMEDWTGIADEMETQLRDLGTPERAAGTRRYLKHDLDHLGATVWQVRRVVRATADERPELSHDDLIALAETLWSKPVFERRLAAAMLLEARVELLGPDDLGLLERLLRDSGTWALVDVLAGDVTGELIARYPNAAARLDRWAADDDFWIRRSALLAMLVPLRRDASFDRFGRYADSMLDEKEFFIRKAIGWVLRETGKRRPQQVFEWLAPRTHRASGVTVREAVKYLEPKQREALLAAYKAKRPTSRD